MKVQLIVRLYANCILLYVSNTPLIVKVCNRFSIGVND